MVYKIIFSPNRNKQEPTNHQTTIALAMNLNLDQNEIQFILNVLGDLPAKTGVWPLIVKIKEQAEAQIKPEES